MPGFRGFLGIHGLYRETSTEGDYLIMTIKHLWVVVLVWCVASSAAMADTGQSDWSIDLGARWFKFSADSKPAEIDYNPVFDRWERIRQNHDDYDVSDYAPLEALFFNMDFGVDVFVRYKKYFWFRLGYDYSNPLGIGGQGHIDYTDRANGERVEETKKFSYTSHQINTFFGPLAPVQNGLAEIYLGFSPMAPTWVRYQESYTKKIDGARVTHYERTFSGFFGSCRALIGMQVRTWEKLKLGSEMAFTFLNYMKLSSGKLNDNSFRFPLILWNFTIRYQVY
jgi:hypothetical protein